MRIRGLRYHYLDEGLGEPLLMLHGNPTWSFYYRRLIRGLRSEYRVIAPDHIGCGLSEKPDASAYEFRLQRRVTDLEEFIDRLGIAEKLTLVLHDWGGMIGMAYARRHPQRIGRFVLFNTAAFLPPGGKRLPLRLRIVRDGGPLAEAAVLGLNLFARAALFMAPRRRLRSDVRAGLIAPYDRPRHRLATFKFVQDIPLAATDPSYAVVAEVDRHLDQFTGLPMLICWGLHDFVFDADYLSEWRRRFPAAEVHTFDAAGHYLLEDVPEEALFRIRRFLVRHRL
jgi:haloalkane dehalogenase